MKMLILVLFLAMLGTEVMGQSPSIREEFMRLANTYQKNESLSQKLWFEIDSIYREERRAYHNMDHLQNIHQQLMSCKHLLTNYDIVFMAMVYHDIVYFTKDGTNELKSAEHVKKRLSELNFPTEKIEPCISMILATQKHAKSKDEDTNYFLDADLSILGLSAPVYDAYITGIMKEYQAGPEFLKGRKRFMERFLSQERIYHTDFFYELYETAARENIQREIEK